ncbi:TetR/AcrR family transcriptional regulator [Leucobacter rhizosphaerae]|uniref:TetR/AcrR family transcriptional regulator n=1 Tax=Leucobacter rhizosphaerae TaxID=2932245 RepID=A0ABY4FUX7_9MICO|nr:TetR/AcrR family transcriptional regulator [Leucobacter rhizosphaerae]UOQ60109.1 TetR/AcrR family transcriptional regulator [Leucobacter rhizosphaerae]
MTDARIVRTRAALHAAITQLASTKPVPSISVSELAALAGINRVTFYKHFSSPAEVLGSALALDLDSTREHYISSYAEHSGDPVEIFTASIDQILDHIDRLRPLYVLSVTTPQDGTVPNLLADHFTETISQYLEQRAAWQPELPEFDRAVVARFFAHGLVGAIKAWVQSGSTAHEPFLRSVLMSAPAWWFPAAA